MLVFAIVTVPSTNTEVPIKSVAAPPFILIFVATEVRLKSVAQFTAPEPAVMFTAMAPVVLPIVIVLAAASVPTLIAPVPDTKAKVALVVVKVDPPDPALILTAVAPVMLPMVIVLAIAVPILIAPVPESTTTLVAPVWLPIVIVLAAASAPRLIAPVPVTKEKAPLTVVHEEAAVPEFTTT